MHIKNDRTPEGAAAEDVGAVSARWIEALLTVAGHYRIDCSPEQLRLADAWDGDGDAKRRLGKLARQAGLAVRFVDTDVRKITQMRLPVILVFKDGQVAVAVRRNADRFALTFSGDGGLGSDVAVSEVADRIDLVAVIRPAGGMPDGRIDAYIEPYRKHWLRSIVLSDLRPYVSIMLASLAANVLALASVIFSMQVYDRVVPAQSFPTLFVLGGGALMAVLFAFIMRQMRMKITDVIGKRADLRISDKVFGHALRVKNTARPRATGTFIAQLRELEHVREMMTSSAVSAIADIPFFLLFCAIFWWVAGSLVWVPAVAVVLLIAPGILAQKKLHRLAKANMRESALRNAMLVEAVQGLDDIKLLQAEERFQNHWNHYNAVNADNGMKLRDLVGTLGNWTQTVQGMVYIAVVAAGAPAVMFGDMTTGALVAAAMLSTRMLAPLASVTQILNRWQQARIAGESLDKIMMLPVDHPENAKRIHKPIIEGAFHLKNAVFSYEKEPVLTVDSLKIAAGSKVGIIGRNGAGKSTLLQGLSGLMEARSGTVLVDGVNIGHVDPADLRRHIGLAGQNARLFYGTIRENLCLGAPNARDEELIEALERTGAWEFVRATPEGLDRQIQEGGHGLSGGQAQAIILSRLLLREPSVVLLDEPTSALDETAEQKVLSALGALGASTTLVIATHKPSVLALVDRLIVVSNGRIIMDGARDDILARLRKGEATAANRRKEGGK
ncbi:type I secretion system permease/ATPase [Martelella lutilitoris]|uniref:Type I secretion system permease/ATPase n=2 Tax=Martelella lutilitoris TaxID=2583532 RepID=A0A5C4JTF5_9HYPH|nr:type I secretion system permease/ATPase [Martelella lutilitoris]